MWIKQKVGGGTQPTSICKVCYVLFGFLIHYKLQFGSMLCNSKIGPFFFQKTEPGTLLGSSKRSSFLIQKLWYVSMVRWHRITLFGVDSLLSKLTHLKYHLQWLTVIYINNDDSFMLQLDIQPCFLGIYLDWVYHWINYWWMHTLDSNTWKSLTWFLEYKGPCC